MSAEPHRGRTHTLFVVGIVLKMFDGILELVGAALVLVVGPHRMNQLAVLLTRHELSEEPRDFIATHVLTFMHDVAGPRRWFAAAYLFTHGIIKVVLVIELLRRRYWAYPAMITVLAGFTAYQGYLIWLHRTVAMIALTVLDVIVIALVWHEWRRVRTLHRGQRAP